MPLTRELEKQAKENIYIAIDVIIERYLAEGVNIYDIEKYFKMKKSFNTLLNDINYAGRRFFDDSEDYPGFVKNILKKVILDKKSDIETDYVSENKIIKFNEYLTENIITTDEDMTVEYLFNDIGYSEEDKDILSSIFNTKTEYIESKDAQYCVYSVTDFKADVLKNNRVSFDVLILAYFQIEKMKENIVKKIVSGLFSKISEEIDYMGIRIKPHTLMDKDKLKESVKKLVNTEEVLNMVTKLTSYTFDNKYNDYYIWKKIN
jgi:hypothetical protein